MPGRNYSQDLASAISLKAYRSESFDMPVEIRPLPDCNEPGELDARVRSIEEDNWASNISFKFARPKEKSQKESLADAVENLRGIMGFPNSNLNTVEIYTKYTEITVEERQVGIWRYFPRKGREKGRPAFIYFHGGGWIGGSVYVSENPCRLIAELADAVVFNIDYALAPERPYPAGFNDCYSAVEHIWENCEAYGIDRERITIGGDSAGGNLAASVSLHARNEGKKMIRSQVLIYPAVARAQTSESFFTWSEDSFQMAEKDSRYKAKFLTNGKPKEPEQDIFTTCYLSGDYSKLEDPYVNPLITPDFSGLPQTLIVSAEFDGLRLQEEFYGTLLAKAGVDVKAVRYLGCGHAFLDYLGFVPQAENLCQLIAEMLKS